MKTNAIIRIVIWCIVIALLCVILFVGLNFRPFSLWHSSLRRSEDPSVATAVPAPVTNTDPTSTVLDTDATVRVPVSEVQDIEIEWISGSIRILPADGEEICFTESAVSDAKYAMVWKQKNEKLTIRFCEENTFRGFSSWQNLIKDLTIQVPRDWICNSLEIDSASTALEVSDLTIREVEVDSASGECIFHNCTVDEFDLDTASGDVRFTGTLNSLDCDSASANVYAVLENVPSRIEMDSMSGDLDLTLPPEAGFTLNMDAMSSDFTSDFATTSRNGSHICGDGSCRITMDGMSGSVIIRKGVAGVSPTSLPATHHTHTDECRTNPSSCPDNAAAATELHHTHTDACHTDPSSCPDNTTAASHHTHTEKCSTDPSSCSEI